MRPGLGTAHRRSALVGRGKDGAEGCRARHRGESRWKIVAGAEELIVVDAIGGRDARDGIALPDILLDRCIEEAVSHRPSRANSVQEKVEAVAAGAELELGIGIDGIDRKSTRLTSSNSCAYRMPSSACSKKTI